MKDDEPSKDEKIGGAKSAVDRLERHASKLIQNGTSPKTGNETPAARASSLRRFSGMGFEFLAVILIFGLVGQWLDNRFGWHGIATVVAVSIAAIGDLYLQIKMLLKDDSKDRVVPLPQDQDSDD